MSHVRLDYIPVVSNSVVNGHATHVQLDYILEVSHSVVNDHATILIPMYGKKNLNKNVKETC